MKRWMFLLLLGWLVAARPADAGETAIDIDSPVHKYSETTPRDRFSQVKEKLEKGDFSFDFSSEKKTVEDILRWLEIPVSSQMLVFSTTSLQLGLINPSNPRALYFSDDLYLGYVPGGRIELIAFDADLGAIFYIFNIPREVKSITVERSNRCMNCHVGEDTRYVPGLALKSVIPGPSGGSLIAYRLNRTGHDIPFSERFGGWYVTQESGLTNHHGNYSGKFNAGELTKVPLVPGEKFSWDRYPAATSSLSAQLLHEHQAGFLNRVVSATYRARELLASQVPEADSSAIDEPLNELARDLTRYILFADEPPLPGTALETEPFAADFAKGRRAAKSGASLRDLDMKDRLLKYRCSYMVYSTAFQGLPKVLKAKLYHSMHKALEGRDPDYLYLAAAERKTILEILNETLPEFKR